MEERSIRILVVGDSGVGKSSLVHQLCYGSQLQNPTWTIGCHAEVMIYRGISGRSTYVEFVDVGGNQKYKASRKVFYSNFDGIIFVYDLSNVRSYMNVRKWLNEIQSAKYSRGESDNTYEFLNQNFSSVPKLVIGNKADKIQGSNNARRSNSMEDVGIDSIETNALSGFIDFSRLNAFFDRVVSTVSSNDEKDHATNYYAANPNSDTRLRHTKMSNMSTSSPLSYSSKQLFGT